MTALFSLLFIAMIPIDCKITTKFSLYLSYINVMWKMIPVKLHINLSLTGVMFADIFIVMRIGVKNCVRARSNHMILH